MCTYLDKVGSTYYFRRPVPKDLLGYFTTQSGAVRTEWKISLRVKDRDAAKRLIPEHAIETDSLIEGARSALARQELPQITDNGKIEMTPAEIEELEARQIDDDARKIRFEQRREMRVLVRQRRKLSTLQLTEQEAAWRDLVNEEQTGRREAEAALEAMRRELEQYQSGPSAAQVVPQRYVRARAGETLLDLYDSAVAASQMREKTKRDWRLHVLNFVEHIGHDDVRRVSVQDVLGWVKKLESSPSKRGRPLSPQTVRKSYLPALRQALDEGKRIGILSTNVAANLPLNRARPTTRTREKEFRDNEVKDILKQSMTADAEPGQPHMKRARRWVPWLCAYTGARVGEILQLRPQDVQQQDGIWSILITPEAGSTKTDKPRWVPLHEHLIEQGFVEAVSSLNGPLFYSQRSAERKPVEPYKGSYNRLRAWMRSIVPDPKVQPFHAWRHTFKTRGRDYHLDPDTLDAIQGHEPPTEGKAYGSFSIRKKAEELSKLPRFEIVP